jgi:hypothetical protein
MPITFPALVAHEDSHILNAQYPCEYFDDTFEKFSVNASDFGVLIRPLGLYNYIDQLHMKF